MTFNGFPQYFALFAELEDLVKQKFPQKNEIFRGYNMDLAFKLRYLELVCLRYKDDKEKWERTARRMRGFIENVKSESLSQKELQQESEILGKQSIQYSELLMLDIDSFFVFARILLDRITFLLTPLYKGIVTKQDVAMGKGDLRGSFRVQLDWFKNNPESVLDPTFYDKMISFRKWFYEKLREPRNKIIIHPLDHFRSEISLDGKLKRIRYELRTSEEKKEWKRMESTDFPEISELFKTIIEFLEFLNEYFSEKVRVHKTIFNELKESR